MNVLLPIYSDYSNDVLLPKRQTHTYRKGQVSCTQDKKTSPMMLPLLTLTAPRNKALTVSCNKAL